MDEHRGRTRRTRRRQAYRVLGVLVALLAPGLVWLQPATAAPPAQTFRASGVRWNPCVRIDYRVNLDGAPSKRAALADVKAAASKVAKASGLPLHYAGQTGQRPGAAGRKGTYPKGTEIVIAWADTGSRRSTYLHRDALATGDVWTKRGEITQAFVIVNRRWALPQGFKAGRTSYKWKGRFGPLMMHELGHVAGLEHVKDKRQIMHPQLQDQSDWGAGDRSGLRKVGRSAGCIAASRR